MGEIGQNILRLQFHMTAVVENGHIGIHTADRFGGALIIFCQNIRSKFIHIVHIFGIQSCFDHIADAVRTAAMHFGDDVDKDTVAIRIIPHDFLQIIAEIVDIRGVETESVPPGIRHAAVKDTFRVDSAPFRVDARNILVQAAADINGDFDIDLVAGIDLRTEQIEFQTRVHPSDFGGVITFPVVTAGKAGDGIDMSFFQRRLPLCFIEFFPDAVNVGRSVKVQMDLTETQFMHDIFLSVIYFYLISV